MKVMMQLLVAVLVLLLRRSSAYTWYVIHLLCYKSCYLDNYEDGISEWSSASFVELWIGIDRITSNS